MPEQTGYHSNHKIRTFEDSLETLTIPLVWHLLSIVSGTPRVRAQDYAVRGLPCLITQTGYHNLCPENHSMPDPSLTPKGKEQCHNLARNFPYLDSIGAIVASPLRRTIYTALYGFKPLIEKGMPVIALPEICETADVPCDTGTDIGVLKEEMKDKPVDLSRVKEGWNAKTGKWAPTADAIDKRAREARQWLKSRSEDEIVVVTHGGLLHYFTEDWSDFIEANGTHRRTKTDVRARLTEAA